jgi:hypothetical protein
MKPTSQPTRNSVLAAIPLPPDALLNMNGLFPPVAQTVDSVKATRPAAVESSSAYGCVDWYLYPDAKPESAKA